MKSQTDKLCGFLSKTSVRSLTFGAVLYPLNVSTVGWMSVQNYLNFAVNDWEVLLYAPCKNRTNLRENFEMLGSRKLIYNHTFLIVLDCKHSTAFPVLPKQLKTTGLPLTSRHIMNRQLLWSIQEQKSLSTKVLQDWGQSIGQLQKDICINTLTSNMGFSHWSGPNFIELLSRKYCLGNLSSQEKKLAENLPEPFYTAIWLFCLAGLWNWPQCTMSLSWINMLCTQFLLSWFYWSPAKVSYKLYSFCLFYSAKQKYLDSKMFYFFTAL